MIINKIYNIRREKKGQVQNHTSTPQTGNFLFLNGAASYVLIHHLRLGDD